MLQPSAEVQTIGKVFDDFSNKGHLTIIYHNKRLGGKKLSSL